MLTHLNEKYNLAIWSMNTRKYCDLILSLIDPKQIFFPPERRRYRPKDFSSRLSFLKQYRGKDLNELGFGLRTVVMVETHVFAFKHQKVELINSRGIINAYPTNGFKVIQMKYDGNQTDVLEYLQENQVLCRVMDSLASLTDVRPFLLRYNFENNISTVL